MSQAMAGKEAKQPGYSKTSTKRLGHSSRRTMWDRRDMESELMEGDAPQSLYYSRGTSYIHGIQKKVPFCRLGAHCPSSSYLSTLRETEGSNSLWLAPTHSCKGIITITRKCCPCPSSDWLVRVQSSTQPSGYVFLLLHWMGHH